MEWHAAEGTQSEKPKELDLTSSATYVFYRRNIERVEATEEEPAKWVYEEMEQSKEEYLRQEAELNSPATALIMQNMSDLQMQTAELQLKVEMLAAPTEDAPIDETSVDEQTE